MGELMVEIMVEIMREVPRKTYLSQRDLGESSVRDLGLGRARPRRGLCEDSLIPGRQILYFPLWFLSYTIRNHGREKLDFYFNKMLETSFSAPGEPSRDVSEASHNLCRSLGEPSNTWLGRGLAETNHFSAG